MKKWIAFGFMIIAAALLLLLPNSPQKKYFHNQGNIFGTYYNIRYDATEDLHQTIKERMQDIDTSLSMFNKQSVISRINRNDIVATDMLFEEMYVEAYSVSELSEGAFDITVAPLVNAWGFGTHKALEDQNLIPDLDSIKEFVGYQKTSLHNHTLVKADPRITLDASAIAKGYACDVIANMLQECGADNWLVDIGGEVVLKGVNERGNAWRVGISRPKSNAEGIEDELQYIIESSNLSMATSGNYLQYYYHQGQRRSHTIDPRTGFPVEHQLLSATVVASSCMRADALATACMVLGEAEALNLINKTKDAACYLIVASGDSIRISLSENWNY